MESKLIKRDYIEKTRRQVSSLLNRALASDSVQCYRAGQCIDGTARRAATHDPL